MQCLNHTTRSMTTLKLHSTILSYSSTSMPFSLGSYPQSFKFCHVLLNHLPQFFFDINLPLVTCAIPNLSHLLTSTSLHLFIGPNYLYVASLMLSAKEATPTFCCITLFLISSFSMPTHPSKHPYFHYLYLLNLGILCWRNSEPHIIVLV